MASDKDFIEFIVDQIDPINRITYRKMFGDYAIYSKSKVVALICDNQVFIKPTEGGKKFIGEVEAAPPYPGAKDWYLIEDKTEDREWLSELIQITCKELPEPKPKNSKHSKKK
jgi:TfoX/Sxy family transcriptional regulator of competence genes